MDDRLREAEIKLGGVAQRVQDHEEKFRQFYPLVLEQGLMRQTLEGFADDLREAHEAIRELGARLDQEHDERVQGQAERKRELEEAQAARDVEMKVIEEARLAQAKEMRSRLQIATISLAGVFLTALAAVLVQLLTGGPA